MPLHATLRISRWRTWWPLWTLARGRLRVVTLLVARTVCPLFQHFRTKFFWHFNFSANYLHSDMNAFAWCMIFQIRSYIHIHTHIYNAVRNHARASIRQATGNRWRIRRKSSLIDVIRLCRQAAVSFAQSARKGEQKSRLKYHMAICIVVLEN